MNLFLAVLLSILAVLDTVTLFLTKVPISQRLTAVILVRVFCLSYAAMYFFRVWSFH